jgi:FeS assembly protein IscX
MSEHREPLYWESTYAIVRRLMQEYPAADLDGMGRQTLLEIILALPDFADESALANQSLLDEILRVWYEETRLT